jgi:serine/threonine-protein phosphatase 2A regulatory subunit B'
MIRKAINECFYSLIHEKHKFNGASEMIINISPMVSGFNVPLREENVIMFKSIIVPLHKVETYSQFSESLRNC